MNPKIMFGLGAVAGASLTLAGCWLYRAVKKQLQEEEIAAKGPLTAQQEVAVNRAANTLMASIMGKMQARLLELQGNGTIGAQAAEEITNGLTFEILMSSFDPAVISDTFVETFIKTFLAKKAEFFRNADPSSAGGNA